jgi:tetratricopeptide (TPR) repeat protein
MPVGIGENKTKLVAVAGVLVILGSIALEFLIGWGIIPIDIPPGMIIGVGILTGTGLICCGAMCLMGSYAQNMPEYGEMEIKFKEGKAYFDDSEWDKALEVFQELMGPEKNHKRALYYAARCSEEKDDYEAVKEYCRAYLKMQPKDKEVWEMLSNAHKKLFEYEEAEDAMNQANKFA